MNQPDRTEKSRSSRRTSRFAAWLLIVPLVVLSAPSCKDEPQATPSAQTSSKRDGASRVKGSDRTPDAPRDRPREPARPVRRLEPDPRLLRTLRGRLETLTQRLKELTARARRRGQTSKTQVKEATRIMVQKLEKKLADARTLVDRLKRSTADERAEVKSKADRAVDALEQDFQTVEKKLSW